MPDTYLWDVFLSHNHRDTPRVRQLAERLRDASLRVWLDEWVLEPGADVYVAIEHGLEYARTLILCMSPAAFGSDWVQLERSTALFRDPANRERRFIPLLLEDCRIPDTLRRFLPVDWRSDNDAAFTKLRQACQPPGGLTTSLRPVDHRDAAPPGGAIRHDDPWYIARTADAEVVAAARRPASTLVIKAPRQMGKSSLLKRYLAACQQENTQTLLLDFSLFTDTDLVDYPTFLTQLASALGRRAGLPPHALPSHIPSQAMMVDFLEYTLLAAVPGPIVVAFDEADKLLGRDYQSDFFSMLRYWHERRTDTPPPAWARAALALVISTEPYLLINDAMRSPFNVGLLLELAPFTAEECWEFNRRHSRPLYDTEVIQLRELLGGHPYLTQLAYYHLMRPQLRNFATLVREATERYGPFGLHLRAMERKLSDDADQSLLAAMREVVRNGTVPSRDVFDRLHGAGLVYEVQGRVVPANNLYARFFGGVS